MDLKGLYEESIDELNLEGAYRLNFGVYYTPRF